MYTRVYAIKGDYARVYAISDCCTEYTAYSVCNHEPAVSYARLDPSHVSRVRVSRTGRRACAGRAVLAARRGLALSATRRSTSRAGQRHTPAHTPPVWQCVFM